MKREDVKTFDPQLTKLADLAKALAHPGRLRILQILARTQGCICGDIVQQLPFSQSTVSQHLKELKRVGLVTGAISGPRTCYCLDSATILRAQSAFTELFTGMGCCPPAENEGELHEL